MSFIVLTIFIGGIVDGSKYRFARTLTVTRANSFNSSNEMLPLSPSAHPLQKQERTAPDHGTLESRVSHSYQPVNADDTEMERGSSFAADDGHGRDGEHKGPEVSARRIV
jgi:hypothetical protein